MYQVVTALVYTPHLANAVQDVRNGTLVNYVPVNVAEYCQLIDARVNSSFVWSWDSRAS